MPRNISFSLTTDQVIAGTKDVTRRTGWEFAKVGDILTACEKCMGLKKGQKIIRLCQIRLIAVDREPLSRMLGEVEYGKSEVIREGFPHLTPTQFVVMFSQHNHCRVNTIITRMEFEYL